MAVRPSVSGYATCSDIFRKSSRVGKHTDETGEVADHLPEEKELHALARRRKLQADVGARVGPHVGQEKEEWSSCTAPRPAARHPGDKTMPAVTRTAPAASVGLNDFVKDQERGGKLDAQHDQAPLSGKATWRGGCAGDRCRRERRRSPRGCRRPA